MRRPVSVVTNKGVLYNYHRIVSVNEIDFKFTHIFFKFTRVVCISKMTIFIYHVLWILWKLKDCEHESGPNIKNKCFFPKIWLKINVLFYFKSFSYVSSCVNEIHIFCFSSKLSFRYPFHSVFHSVSFSVPRFSNTPVTQTQLLPIWLKYKSNFTWPNKKLFDE